MSSPTYGAHASCRRHTRVPEAPRNVLANILRGRIRDLRMGLLQARQTAEAIEHLRRAVAFCRCSHLANIKLASGIARNIGADAGTHGLHQSCAGAPDAVHVARSLNNSTEGERFTGRIGYGLTSGAGNQQHCPGREDNGTASGNSANAWSYTDTGTIEVSRTNACSNT